MRNLEVKCGRNKHFQLKKRRLTFKNINYQAEKKKTAVNRTRICAYGGDGLIFKTHSKNAFRAKSITVTAQLSYLIPVQL